MKSKTITIQNIIETEFINADILEITNKLKQHQLYDFINRSLEQINFLINQKSQHRDRKSILNVSSIGSIMLIKFNEYLRKLAQEGKVEQKEELEYLLGNFMKRVLTQIVEGFPLKEKQAQLTHIIVGLKQACGLYQYNFEKLSEFLSAGNMALEIFSLHENSERPILNKLETIPYLKFKEEHPESLNTLIEILIKENITQDTDKIKLLFSKPTGNLAIEFNEKNHRHILKFLAALKDSKLLSYHGCDGFYKVFLFHVKNFELGFLNGKTPQKRIDSMRKHKDWLDKEKYFDTQFQRLFRLSHSAQLVG